MTGRAHGAVPARIGVIRNPKSHRNKGQAEPAFAPESLHRDGLHCVAPVTKAELASVLAELAGKGIDVLVVDGGDGTMRDVLTHGHAIFGASWPDLMILPKGKTNALAVDLGMPDRLSLEQAIAALPTARAVARRPLLIERLDGEGGAQGETAMGFILGAGVFGAAIDAGQVAHRFGAFQGFAVAMAAGFAVVGALFGFGNSPWRAQSRIRVFVGDGEAPHSGRVPRDTRYAAGFSSLGRFPLGMRPFGKYVTDIHYLLVDAPLRRVIARIPAILMGSDSPSFPMLGIHRGASTAFVMELGERFILDGEAFAPGRYRLELGPELRFLVP